jgi:hypothetical protein
MKAIAFDPGGTTGYAMYEDGRFYKHGELTGVHHLALYDLLRDWQRTGEGPYYVIYERFDNRNTDFASLVSLEYIGVIKMFAQANQYYGVPQGSAMAKDFVTNDKLKAVNWYVPYKQPHALDATRHLFYWIINGSHMYDEYRDKLLQQLKVNLK